MILSSPLLRTALALDSAACAAMGIVLATAAVPADALGLPDALIRGAGLLLLPCAAVLGWLASRAEVPRLAIQAVIAVNLLWIADSLLVLLSGWLQPTAAGIALVLVQAAAVAAVTELEWLGLRRSTVLAHAA